MMLSFSLCNNWSNLSLQFADQKLKLDNLPKVTESQIKNKGSVILIQCPIQYIAY